VLKLSIPAFQCSLKIITNIHHFYFYFYYYYHYYHYYCCILSNVKIAKLSISCSPADND